MPRAEQPGSKAGEGSTCEHRAAAKGEHEPILWRAKVTRALLQQVREHTLMSWNNETLTLPILYNDKGHEHIYTDVRQKDWTDK